MREAKRIERRQAGEQAIAGLPDLLSRIYSARKVSTVSQVDYSLTQLEHFADLSNISQAAELAADAITQQKKILFVGDFDVDGATSCAVGMRLFAAFGANNPDYLVPNRFEFGYGLTPELVEVAVESKPDLIITVDNGIANHEGVDCARQQGIQVIVTDHHLPAETLPSADAIVNPNLPGDAFVSKNLAGVGVVFYFCLAIRHRLRELGWFTQQSIKEPNLAQVLDLVALGTIADLVKLDQNNRVLVYQGLERVRAGQACAGIRALLDIVGRQYQNISAADFAFALGPRINAAGRMDDMTVGIECLLTDDYEKAFRLASRLNDLNLERREVEQQMREQAESIVKHLSLESDESKIPDAICLYDADWHQGVIGIVASRIKELYHRPVIVFAKVDEQTLKGSARSIKGLNIRDALALVDAEHPHLMQAFGGHAMAAGLTLAEDQYQTFVEQFTQTVSKLVSRDDLQQVIYTDGSLNATELNLETAELLFRSGPWGQGFPEPLFEGEFNVADCQILKDRHVKFFLKNDQGQSQAALQAIAFNVPSPENYITRDKVRIVYRLAVNEFRGMRSAQLMIEHIDDPI
jgi:single-stranded-DNA-specific exonuclease